MSYIYCSYYIFHTLQAMSGLWVCLFVGWFVGGFFDRKPEGQASEHDDEVPKEDAALASDLEDLF